MVMLSTILWPICHLYVLFGNNSICVLCPLLVGLFAFLPLSCVSSLYILDTDPLLDMWSANIFSHSTGCFLFSWWLPLMGKIFYVTFFFVFFFWTLICKAILIFSPISCIFKRFLLAFLLKKYIVNFFSFSVSSY